MKLSFIVPVYNAEKYLSRCLDSLLQQDYSDYEIICINDGSKDSSQKILEEYKKNFPQKFVIISQENQGIGPARNNAFKQVSGDYTWFIDNDDCIMPNVLNKIVSFLNQFNIDILNIDYISSNYSTNPFFNTKSELTCVKENQEFVLYDYFSKMRDAPWSKIYSTKFLKNNNLQFLNIFGEDTSVTFKLYTLTNSIYKIPEPIYAWFLRDTSFSHSIFTKKHFETFPILLDTLYQQSIETQEKFKPYFHYLILKKAKLFLNLFETATITEDLYSIREKCLLNIKDMIRKIPANLFYTIDEETISKINSVKSSYENSYSWKITKPLRLISHILKK